MRASLVLATLLFVPGLLDVFGAPKALVLRVIGGGLGVALLALEFGDRLRRRPAPAESWTALDLAVVAWVFAAIAATLLARSPHVAWLGELRERDGLATTLALAGLYAATRASHRDPREVERTLEVFVFAAGCAAGYALLQLGGLDPIRWADPMLYGTGVAAVLRPGATLGNANLLGIALAAALAISIGRATAARAPLSRELPLLAVIAAALAATLSRGAWLAGAAGAIAALIGTRSWRDPAVRRRAAGALLAVAIAAAIVIATRGGLVVARLAEGASEPGGSGAARIELARAALAMWRAHALAGVGPNGFGLAFPGFQSATFWRGGWIGSPAHAHSAALETLATRGALGALAGVGWIAALAVALRGRMARGDDPAVPALLGGTVALAVAGATNVIGPAGAALFVVLSALAFTSGREVAFRAGPAWALAAALLIGWPALGELRALARGGAARVLLEASVHAPVAARPRMLALADSVAAAALRFDSREDELWRLRTDTALMGGTLALAQGDTATATHAARAAVDAASSALARVSARAVNHQRLASALALSARVERGGPERDAFAAQAMGEWAIASRTAPFDGLAWVSRVRDEAALGRIEAALASARRLVAIYPEASPGHALEADLLHAMGREAEARAALERARAARRE